MRFILFIHLFLLSISNFDDPQLIFKIDFQSGFENDTIGLKIDNTLVFNNIVTTTCRETELTTLSEIKMYFESNNTIVQYQNEKIKLHCKKLERYKIEVFVNKKKFVFYIKPQDGTYIGFNKSDDKVNFIQSKSQFYYY